MKKKTIKKVEHLMNFISHIDQCTKKEFDKLCKKKEILWKN
jgi:hypothetical protein